MERLLVVAHVSAIGVYLGSCVFLAVLIETVGLGVRDAVLKRERWADLFRVYNPLAIAALGVAVMTGAWSITPLKESLGKSYFEDVGRALAGKLGLAFLVILTGTWVSFGICHRVVRAHQGMIPVTIGDLDKLRARLRIALWLVCALTIATIWWALGIRTGHAPA